MTAGFRLRTVGPLHLDLLGAMYDRFDPLGAALGLPPHIWEARQKWIGSALRELMNVAAFTTTGAVVGHSFLVADNPVSAEIAVFVHQGSRRKGIGASLLRWLLEWARAARLERVWAVTAPENRAALRLLESCGFHRMRSDLDADELEIDLRPLPASRKSAMQAHSSNPKESLGKGRILNMLTTSAVLDHHLKSFADRDVDAILADYAPDAVLFVPNGPLRGRDEIRELLQGLVSEFSKPGSSFTMQQRWIDGDHAYILWTGGNGRQFL